MKKIKDMRILNAMSRISLIELHSDTKKFGYIREGNPVFIYKKEKYKTIYSEGCFFPFVFKLK